MEQAEFEQQVDKYLDGQLGRDQIEKLWEEMVKDPARLEYVKTVANTREVVKRMKGEIEEKDTQKFGINRYVKYAVAATIALLIGTLSLYQWSGTEQEAIEPIEAIELNYYRGGNDDISTVSQDVNQIINKAVSLANSDSTSHAIQLLKQKRDQIEKPENAALLSLNIGSIQYNDGKFKQAIKSFNQVIDKKNHIDVLTLEKAYWFLGNSHFQQGDMIAARKAIKNAYELNGAYRRVAGTYLNAMANKN